LNPALYWSTPRSSLADAIEVPLSANVDAPT
jgi:hypothetical protein